MLYRDNLEKVTALHYLVPQFKKRYRFTVFSDLHSFLSHFFLPKSISSLNVIYKSFNSSILLLYFKNSLSPMS